MLMLMLGGGMRPLLLLYCCGMLLLAMPPRIDVVMVVLSPVSLFCVKYEPAEVATLQYQCWRLVFAMGTCDVPSG